MWIRVTRQHVVICHMLVKYFLSYCIRSVQKCKLPSVRLFHRAGSLIKLTSFAGCLLLCDSRTCVWTTCPRLLPESGTAGVQPATFCVASQHSNNYSMVPHGAHLSPNSQHNSPNSYHTELNWESCCVVTTTPSPIHITLPPIQFSMNRIGGVVVTTLQLPQFSSVWYELGELCCKLGERWALCGTILQHQAA